MRIALVGFGDGSRGDDAVGVEVISRVDRSALPEDVFILNGGTNVLKTLETVTGFDGLVIVDAASMGESPGAVKTFTLNDLVMTESPRSVTFHAMKLDTDLIYAHKFMNLPETLIVGIQPASFDSPGLSQVLLDAMDDYTEAVTTALRHLSQLR